MRLSKHCNRTALTVYVLSHFGSSLTPCAHNVWLHALVMNSISQLTNIKTHSCYKSVYCLFFSFFCADRCLSVCIQGDLDVAKAMDLSATNLGMYSRS